MRRIATITIVALTAVLAFTFANHPAEAGGGCHSDTLTDAAGVAVALEKRCFEPMVVRIDAGVQVTWTNNDPDSHAVTGVANSWGNYDELGQGDTVTYQFDNNGVFPYFCYLHPSMVGAVVVGDGSAASTGSANDGGVKAVSAEAPGGATGTQTADILEEDGGGLRTAPIAIAVGVLLTIGGLAGALVVRRRNAVGE